MGTEKLSQILKAALIAGVAAGLALGLFHFLFTEPLIDRAMALESEAAHAGPFSREVQKVMLLVGSGLYGLVVGAIFAFAFGLLERRLPGHRPHVKAMLLAGVLWWSLGLLTQLKYPAILPGGGDAETIYIRQAFLIGFAVLSILAVVVAWLVYHLLGKSANAGLQRRRSSIAIFLYAIVMALGFTLMPSNPRVGPATDDMVRGMLILTLVGQALFWVVLGGVSGLLLRRHENEPKLNRGEMTPGRQFGAP